MLGIKVYTLVLFFVHFVSPQGSGTNGNLRLCVVEGRGSYKRASKFCPTLDQEESGVECVIGADRLDCLRRMGKGTVDFGVFSPEDLVAAQWAHLEVLVTHELRGRPRPFEHSVVAVINKSRLENDAGSLRATLRNTTLCHPGLGAHDLHPLSDTLSEYLESIVTVKSCDPALTMEENRVAAMAKFFGKACKAGPWLPDKARDADLKSRYSSLCAACSSGRCDAGGKYWGSVGALNCLAESAGHFTWAHLDTVIPYFGLTNNTNSYASPDSFAFLCKDGSSQPLTTPDPCVWVNRPWPVLVAKRKTALAVTNLVSGLMNSSALVDGHWLGALGALLEPWGALGAVSRAPLDHLARAAGFREAYSQPACQPPRHITICTSSLLERNKCEWLSEAGNVYGVSPPLQCAFRYNRSDCFRAVQDGDCDVTNGDADWLVTATRDFKLTPLLHETTPIVQKMSNVVAYVRKDANINKMADLRGKRAAFPRFDGYAWHSVLRYFMKESESCNEINDYFSEVCAPGIERGNFSAEIKKKLTKNCYRDGEVILDGEVPAIRSLVEGKSDVAFISMDTYNMYKNNLIQEPWARDLVEIQPVCPEENKGVCFLSWSSIGHIFTSRNLTALRQNEIITVFTKLDELFGKNPISYPLHSAMFSMYGPYNHQINVLFHNNTKNLATDSILLTHPYDKLSLNFERSLRNLTADRCQVSSMTGSFGAKVSPGLVSMILTVALSLYL